MKKSLLITLLAGGVSLLAQSTNLQHFAGLERESGRSLSLKLQSGIPATWRNFYSLFPVERSQDLSQWVPLATLLRTNRFAETVTLLVENDGASQFYRTPTNQLFTPFPPPEGPFRVGVLSRLLTDPTRTNRYVRTNSSFMATIWYPAEAVPGLIPAFIAEQNLQSLGYCTSRDPKGFRSHALPGAPVAATESSYPVVIYSHGDQLTRRDNTRRLENLVSYGFVVISVDHWNCLATVFPDGHRWNGLSIPNLVPGDRLVAEVTTNRGQDVHFILGELAQWNTDDIILKSKLDLQRLGIIGLSFGGGTTTHACQEEPRFKAGISLDGGYERFPIPPVNVPFMIVSGGDGDTYMAQFRNAYRKMYDSLTKDAYWLHLKDAIHCDFNDTPWFDSPTSSARTRRALALDRYTVSFFRKQLRGEDDHLLDGVSAEWPEIDQLLKK